ncbi:hypothetical protein CPAV1605_1267 [seawater metagenome]|uniref:von Willebrand factor type A domain n=1 Tax=seawater metagenome TaxID=1561972 RepID=A0A5E8CK08_9ZZZZ
MEQNITKNYENRRYNYTYPTAPQYPYNNTQSTYKHNIQSPPSYNIASLPPPPIIDRSQLFEEFCDEYEISRKFVEKIAMLSDFNIVFIIDDSGSMKTPLDNNSKFETRWDELKNIVKISIRLATIFNKNGIDLQFLNRKGHENVKSYNNVEHLFNPAPFGRTPLTEKFNQVIRKYTPLSKQVLVVIATDGIPTNKYGYPDIKEFRDALIEKNHSKFYVSFLACSDQKEDIGYLNKLDKKVPNVDTIDDYISELREVRKKQGRNFSYTIGDHVVRLLLGPICKEMDQLDEKKLILKCHIL